MAGLERFADYESDIRGRWSEDALRNAVLWGVLRGDDKGRLRPRDPVTREELAAVVHRLMLSEPEIAMAVRAMASIVHIYAVHGAAASIGSGFWVADWHVVTNAHVVFARDEDGQPREPERLGVWGNQAAGFSPLDPVEVDEIVAVDHDNDLAVLRCRPPRYPVEPVPLPFADKDVGQGMQVWALGHPYNQGWDICKGIIRHPTRVINVWQRSQHVYGLDVPINPGNSGGALVNAEGELVGVPNAGAQGANNFTFAIPKQYVEALLKKAGVGWVRG